MNDLGVALWAIVLLLTANAFFVAAEFALVKARPFRIDAWADESRFGAVLTQRIQRKLEPYLAACQLGITMASLGLGWVGEPAVAHILEPVFAAAGLSDANLHTASFLVGFIIFSSLHIVVGEQVPKTFAIRTAEIVSVWVAWPLHIFYLGVFPLNWALNWASNAILRLFGVQEAAHGEVISGEELKGIISTSAEHGEIAEQKAAFMTNLFAFDERTVGRVMIPRGDVVAMELGASASENGAILQDTKHSRFPVLDGKTGKFVGVVLAKDLYGELLSEGDAVWARLKDYCREPIVVPETLRIASLFDTMRQHRGHMAIVIDEYGELSGIVTLEDLIEEIVGEISDETDLNHEKYPVLESPEGWRAHGLATLADVQRAVGLVVPAELDANTLSGLFMLALGRIPKAGDCIEQYGFRLTVLSVREHHADQVQIEALPVAEPPKS